jgi:hypothetical protein
MHPFAWLPILALAAAALPSQAQSRRIFVNGARMNDVQVMQLSRIQCSFIPDGHYWVDWRTGAWGLAGHPKRLGWLGEACGARHSQRRPSLSERGLLYRPGELIDGR